jgi:hypothetical protein
MVQLRSPQVFNLKFTIYFHVVIPTPSTTLRVNSVEGSLHSSAWGVLGRDDTFFDGIATVGLFGINQKSSLAMTQSMWSSVTGYSLLITFRRELIASLQSYYLPITYYCLTLQ